MDGEADVFEDSLCSIFGETSTVVGNNRKADTERKRSGSYDKPRRYSLPPELDEGNVEYKLKLVDPSPSRLVHLVTQLKWRLKEGQGEAIYQIGVEDNGNMAGLNDRELNCSLRTLNKMASMLGASIAVLREEEVDEFGATSSPRRVVEVLVRKVPDDQQFIDVRLAVLGGCNTGKSTLLGVLTQGHNDDGRGRARLNLFRHLHEIQTGRNDAAITSSEPKYTQQDESDNGDSNIPSKNLYHFLNKIPAKTETAEKRSCGLQGQHCFAGNGGGGCCSGFSCSWHYPMGARCLFERK